MKSYLLIAACVSFLPAGLAWAVPAPASATCNISCTVAEVAEWSNNSLPVADTPDSAAIDIDASGGTSLMLYTNGDVKITTDNPDTVQLSKDALTVYKLEYDASGTDQIGGRAVTTNRCDSFPANDSTTRCVSSNGAVEVTLSVKHSVDSGRYCATQTLTVCWKS